MSDTSDYVPCAGMRDYNYVNANYPDSSEWKARHLAAIRNPIGFELPIVSLLIGWCTYAYTHAKEYETEIGADYVLGPQWRDVGLALRGLLNGQLGRLDAGTIDSIIVTNLTVQGYGEGL